MLDAVKLDAVAAREDLVPPLLFVPLRERRRHVHLLDDVAPADAGIVSAEGNLALLRSVRDDAALSPPEVVVEQILEPHSRDEQEVPAITPPHFDVLGRAVP